MLTLPLVQYAMTYDPVMGSRILFERRAEKAGWECDYGINCACHYTSEGIECLPLDCLRPAPRTTA